MKANPMVNEETAALDGGAGKGANGGGGGGALRQGLTRISMERRISPGPTARIDRCYASADGLEYGFAIATRKDVLRMDLEVNA